MTIDLNLSFLYLRQAADEGFCGGRKGTLLFSSFSSYFSLNEVIKWGEKAKLNAAYICHTSKLSAKVAGPQLL